MSRYVELIEKVARAMHAHPSTFDGVKYENEEPEYRKLYEDKARAAILAVLEHYSDPDNVTSGMLSVLNRETVLGNGPRRVVAGLMRAELERLKGGDK